jgi:general nucleoside transport system ATP-binding protein
MTASTPLALECRDIEVTFGDVVALSGVGIGFERAMIHAVVGQNGAGKTTFARVAAGIVRPDKGEVRIGGEAVPTGHVRASRMAGVELVHQSFALPPSFTIAEAMEFGAGGSGGIFTRRQLAERWKGHLDGLNIKADPGEQIRNLPIETQQGVEIARALVTDAKVLILDEPTAVLSPAGAEILFERVRQLKARGITVILILHKIREVLAVADTVTVLRGGRHVAGPLSCRDVEASSLAEMIIGSSTATELDPVEAKALVGAGAISHLPSHDTPRDETPILELRTVTSRIDAEGTGLKDVSLQVGRGEIVGIAGVEGNGQRALVRAIADLADISGGEILLNGRNIVGDSLAARRREGLRIIPFERNVEGLSLSSSLWENWSIGALLQQPLLHFVSPSAIRRRCDEALATWDVRYTTSAQAAGSLSGGNAQKVILAREVDAGARLIVAAQPTRGLDIGATAFVWRSLEAARKRGCAVLLISSDLDELFDICDRVAVMLSGSVARTFRPPFDVAAVGAAMTGAAR